MAGAQPTEPPAKPRGLSATASHDSVTLTWNDPGDDSITGYVILRRVRENDVGGDFSELAPDTHSTATTYTDDTVAAGLTYTYRIKAINGAGTNAPAGSTSTPRQRPHPSPRACPPPALHNRVVLAAAMVAALAPAPVSAAGSDGEALQPRPTDPAADASRE